MNISHIMKDRFGILILTLTKYIRYLSLRLIYQVQLREQGFDPSKAGVAKQKSSPLKNGGFRTWS